MKKILFLSVYLISFSSSFGQIGNIINTYTPVIGFDPCENKLAAEDASTFNIGDTVLIIQMKGAVIDSTNTSTFGTITDYKNAGNYEFNYVKSKSGNSIQLKNTLTRQYDIPAGKIQLVRVPSYNSITVTSTLTCLPWDGSKGGILVLKASNSVVLNASIDVSGKGFKGGNDPYSSPAQYYCDENQYYYPRNPDLASEKGEGIATIGPDKSFGKGALANGGGSGNSHNSGGGGGSNASQGGFGGYNFEFMPCDAIVPFDNRGTGGKILSYSNILNKIFLGGGGGAGHSNNPQAFESKGGNGSGIIIIIADNLKSNNLKIMANGNNGAACGSTASGCHEGMGGGGAGGTILLSINNYIDNLTIEGKGGNGANMTSAGNYRVGPGGGGSAGITWFDNNGFPANVSTVLTGGLNGVCTAYANDPWGATPGQNGTAFFNLKIPTDTVLFVAGACGVVPVTLTAFEASIISTEIKLNWTTENEDGVSSFTIERSLTGLSDFIPLGTVAAGSMHSYSFNDNTADANQNYFYRLKIIENNGSVSYSEIKKAKINANNKLSVIYPNPSKGTIVVRLNGYLGKAKFSIINSIGQVVLRENKFINNSSPVSLKLNKQPKGAYWLKIETANEKSVERIIIY